LLKGTEIRVGPNLNYAAVTKEIRNDFVAGEARTDIAVRSITDDEILVRSVGIVYNQHKLNLEILQQVHGLNQPVRNEDSGCTHRNSDDSEQSLTRVFKRKFRELCTELGWNKIQDIVQIGSVEALEKELDQVSRKSDLLAEKLDDTTEIDVIVADDQEYNVSNALRRWRAALLKRRQALLKDKKMKKKLENLLSEDMKRLASEENIQVQLPGPSNFLSWMEHISSLTQKLPESTSDLKILSLIKNSIRNKYNLKEVEEINCVEVLMGYLNSELSQFAVE